MDKKREEGSVLVISLLVSIVILILLGVFSGSIIAERKRQERSYRSLRALNLAEAGVEKAIWELNNDSTPPVSGQIPSITGVGFCEYTVTVSGGTVVIQATGYSPEVAIAMQVERAVEVSLTRSSHPLFNHAIFADKEGIVMYNGSAIDSYDSENGPYNDPLNKGSNGDIGTNSTSDGTVELKDNVVVNGGINVGPGGDPEDVIDKNPGAIVTGTEQTMSTEKELPEIIVPPYLLAMTPQTFELSNNETDTINTSSRYEQITLGNNSTLILQGNIELYLEGLDMNNGGQIILASGATVVIYISANSVDFKYGGIVNAGHDATALSILCTNACQTINMHNSSTFCGALYAPKANVELQNSSELFGAIIANGIDAKNKVDIHFDEALLDWTPPDDSLEPNYVFESWREG